MPDPETPDIATMETAWRGRDPAWNGRFFVAVETTGIFCLPACPARPKRENIRFLMTRQECLAAGMRACRRCKP